MRNQREINTESIRNQCGIKEIPRRLETQAEDGQNEKGVGATKKAEKAQAAADSYYNVSSREIILCETSKGYLKSVLQKRFDPKNGR